MLDKKGCLLWLKMMLVRMNQNRKGVGRKNKTKQCAKREQVIIIYGIVPVSATLSHHSVISCFVNIETLLSAALSINS